MSAAFQLPDETNEDDPSAQTTMVLLAPSIQIEASIPYQLENLADSNEREAKRLRAKAAEMDLDLADLYTMQDDYRRSADRLAGLYCPSDDEVKRLHYYRNALPRLANDIRNVEAQQSAKYTKAAQCTQTATRIRSALSRQAVLEMRGIVAQGA